MYLSDYNNQNHLQILYTSSDTEHKLFSSVNLNKTLNLVL